ncbi:MAG: ABC transporter permease [Candidatus Enteromonas sp.]|nr:ABC transporter permease [Candidatus Enteromonas sp.]MDY6094411.1 ABC transporter permease [Candidatus Enteromonas sp.]
MKDSTKYVIERILFIFLTAFIILSLTYILLQLLPIEPQSSQYAEQYRFWSRQVELGFCQEFTFEEYTALADKTGVITIPLNNREYYFRLYPVLIRYVHWLGNVVTRWDWGTSTSSIGLNRDVVEIIMERLPYSMRLNIISIFFSIPLGLGLGVLAALKKNTWVDHTISTVIMIFISVPSFVLISFLLLLFRQIPGFPTQWPSDSQSAASPLLAFQAYIIPVMSLCFGSICSFARYTRAELTEVMSSEFLLLARTKGLTKGQSVVRHALRNSMVPIVPMIIGEFIGILSGSMVLEQIYGIPGIGRLFVEGITNRDYPVVMVDMAIYTLIGLFATLIVDLSYGIVDPRIRMGAKK